MGGEKGAFAVNEVVHSGSPPRGRGKDCVPGTFFTVKGITPAWAGKRTGAVHFRGDGGDHPRVGGEK